MPDWEWDIDAIRPRYGDRQAELLAYPGEIKLTDLHGSTAEMIEAVRIVVHPQGDEEKSRYFWVHHPFSSKDTDPDLMVNEWWIMIKLAAKRSAGIANLQPPDNMPPPDDRLGPQPPPPIDLPPPPPLDLPEPPEPPKRKRTPPLIVRVIQRIRHPFRRRK